MVLRKVLPYPHHCRRATVLAFLLAISVFVQLAIYSTRLHISSLEGVVRDFVQPSVIPQRVSETDFQKDFTSSKDRASSQEALLKSIVGNDSGGGDTNLSIGDQSSNDTGDQVASQFRKRESWCNASVKNLTSYVLSTDEAIKAEKMEKRQMSHILSKSLPKGLHCLGLHLTLEYYSGPWRREDSHNPKLQDLKLYHYVIFTSNIVAASVVVNSTVFHAKEPERHVFHILTESVNYPAMKMWFIFNTPPNTTVDVMNAAHLKWIPTINPDSSVFDHLLSYLPHIFPSLHKILLLKEDVVVYKDLARVWAEDLHGKAGGVLGRCGEYRPHFTSLDQIPGIILFDLHQCKKVNMSQSSHTRNEDRGLVATHRMPSQVFHTFNKLGKSWHILCLGQGNKEDLSELDSAAYVHYYTRSKPWLQSSISKYTVLWTKFMNYNHPFVQGCNVGI